MSPGFGGIVFQNGEAAGEMDLFWILISCCNSTIYRFFCLRLVKFLSEKLSQKSTFTGKINPLNFLKSPKKSAESADKKDQLSFR